MTVESADSSQGILAYGIPVIVAADRSADRNVAGTAPCKDIATRSCKLRLDVRPDRMDDRYLKVLTIPTKELDAP